MSPRKRVRKSCKPKQVRYFRKASYVLGNKNLNKRSANAVVKGLHKKGYLAHKIRYCDDKDGWAVYQGPISAEARAVRRKRRRRK